jgi:hypothetical protein
MIALNKAQVLEICDNDFSRLEPKENAPLCLPHFQCGEFDRESRDVLAYIRELLNGPSRDKIGSPIFHFVVEEPMSSLSEGAKKWVAIIGRETDLGDVQTLAEKGAILLSESETKRLDLEDEEANQVRKAIRNGLMAALHYGLKAAPEVPALNMSLNGEKNFITYGHLEAKVRELCEDTGELDQEKGDSTLILLLKELGVIPEGAKSDEAQKILKIINQAKGDAWKLFGKLDENIQKAQRRANIKGPLAEIDLNVEHESLHFINHLRGLYGLSDEYGKSVEDRYELQIAAHLTWLMARLNTHPVYKTLLEHKDEVTRKFMTNVFHKNDLFEKNETNKVVHLDKRGRATTEANSHNIWDPQVYDSQLPGFEDLPKEARQMYRGGFRPKENLSIFVKAIKDRQELEYIPDALAGEGVMTGINEKDLDPIKNPTGAERLRQFMVAQAEAIASATGLRKAPESCDYKKIPKGTYKVVTKLEKGKKNGQSFNFPAVKIYFNFPVNDTTDSQSIRTEYRLICQDTWLRGNKEEDSMSYHEMYKMKQGVELLDILTARIYNGTIHPVASQFKEWVIEEQAAEMEELEAA